MTKSFTPLNEYKLSKAGLKVYKSLLKFKATNVKEVKLYSHEYEMLLEGFSPSVRAFYLDSMPWEGKTLVRLKR